MNWTAHFDQKMIVTTLNNYAETAMLNWNKYSETAFIAWSNFLANPFFQDPRRVLLLYPALLLLLAVAIWMNPPGVEKDDFENFEVTIYTRRKRVIHDLDDSEIIRRHPMITRSMIR